MNSSIPVRGLVAGGFVLAMLATPGSSYADSQGAKVQTLGVRAKQWLRRRAVNKAEYRVARAEAVLAGEQARAGRAEKMRRLASPESDAGKATKRAPSPAASQRVAKMQDELAIAKHDLEWKRAVLKFAGDKDFDLANHAMFYRHRVGYEGFRLGASVASLGAISLVAAALAAGDNGLAVVLVPPFMSAFVGTEQALARRQAVIRDAQKGVMAEMAKGL
jgi:hypothetical protein